MATHQHAFFPGALFVSYCGRFGEVGRTSSSREGLASAPRGEPFLAALIKNHLLIVNPPWEATRALHPRLKLIAEKTYPSMSRSIKIDTNARGHNARGSNRLRLLSAAVLERRTIDSLARNNLAERAGRMHCCLVTFIWNQRC